MNGKVRRIANPRTGTTVVSLQSVVASGFSRTTFRFRPKHVVFILNPLNVSRKFPRAPVDSFLTGVTTRRTGRLRNTAEGSEKRRDACANFDYLANGGVFGNPALFSGLH
jgi:hypothetical protein